MKFILVIVCFFYFSVSFAITLSPKQCPIDSKSGAPVCWPTSQYFDKQPWVEAYTNLYRQMKTNYVYTKWRQVDFKSLYFKYLPAVQQAAKAHDLKAYYEAIRAFVYSIPDGHVIIFDAQKGVFNPQYRDHDRFNTNFNHLGFSYGFDVVRLHSGKYIAAIVDPNGTAYKAGMRVGAQILRWNGLPIAKAIDEVSQTYRLTDTQTGATTQYINFEKARRLTRAPMTGAKAVKVIFKNPKQGKTEASISAYNDQFKLINQNSLYAPDQLSNGPLEWKLLTPEIGYIRILNEGVPSKTPHETPAYQSALKAIQYFNAHHVKAIILDTRGNLGGSDQLAVDYLDLLADQKLFYEVASGYDKKYKQSVITKVTELHIVPAKDAFKGLVVNLINPGIISSGEGLSMATKWLKYPNGKRRGYVVTMLGTGTFGSFGDPAPMADMPGEFVVEYPIGASLNKHHQIQLDSHYTKSGELVGGVHADHIFKLTAKRAIDKYTNRQDVALDLATKFAQKHLKHKKP